MEAEATCWKDYGKPERGSVHINPSGVAIAASYELPPARFPDVSPHNLYRQVAIAALREWGLRPSDVNGLLAVPSGQGIGAIDIYTHEKLGAELGLQPGFAETLNAGGASFAIMVGR